MSVIMFTVMYCASIIGLIGYAAVWVRKTNPTITLLEVVCAVVVSLVPWLNTFVVLSLLATAILEWACTWNSIIVRQSHNDK